MVSTTKAPSSGCFFRPLLTSVNVDGEKFNLVRTFSDEASALHAILSDSAKDFCSVPDCRKLLGKKVSALQKDPEVQRIIEEIFKAYSPHLSDKASSVNSRNAQLLFNHNSTIERVQAYWKASGNSSYCFTRIDFELIAHLFTKRIEIYSTSSTLEYRAGLLKSERVVLLENTNHLMLDQAFPCYQRCVPQSLLGRVSDTVWYNTYAVSETRVAMVLSDAFSDYFPAEIRNLILEYADFPFRDYVNTGMQAIMESEGWDRTIKADKNWDFVKRFHKAVTSLNCRNKKRFKEMQDVVCREAFPILKSLELGELQSLNDYQNILKQNPNLVSAYFEGIKFDVLLELIKSIPELANKFESLAFKVINECKSPLPAGDEETSLKNSLQLVPNLQRLSILPSRASSDKLFQAITKHFPSIKYLDFNLREGVSLKSIKTFLEQRKDGIQALDLSSSADDSALRRIEIEETRLRGLTVKNCRIQSDGTLIPLLLTFPRLEVLDISGIQLSYEELNRVKNFCRGSLRVLKMSACTNRGSSGKLLDVISLLTNLEELDITKCEMLFSEFHLLKNLKRLHTLRWGGFCFKHTGNGSESAVQYSDRETAKYNKEILYMIPSLKVCVATPIYEITYSDPAPPSTTTACLLS